ncbi:MAG TPA: hypothetical protein DDW65_16740 [Firmicutes bacterium]|jgi:methyl-accepting chemotaxis protein|nr:hypothetical protein [Bacillota bacterium]
MKVKMKLGMRIMLGFGCLMGLIVIMAIFALFNMHLIDGKIAVIDDMDRKLVLSTTMERAVLNISRGVRGIQSKINIDENKQAVNDAVNIYNNSFAVAQKTFYTKEGVAMLAQLRESSVAAIPLINRLIESAQSGKGEDLADENEAIQKVKEWTSAITELEHICEKNSQAGIALAQQTYIHSFRLLSVIVIIALSLGMGLAFYITRSITGPMNSIASRVGESAGQVAAASGQLSASAQQLSQGSTEQAAAIEETSSTLQETASRVQQSSVNTQRAAELSGQATESANKGNAEMKEMMDSIQEIKDSSAQIGRIIKVIDDIAFQTNILALNAAIEAARAGEAGMGFAVVAEEVRNLAQRSAQAAKDTTIIIESNIALSGKGVSVAERVHEALNNIRSQAKMVNELMNEVAAASQEQSQGIEQITESMIQVETVTQQNAANAEESASASEELNSQAESMRRIVRELSELVNGVKDDFTMDTPGRPVHYSANINQSHPGTGNGNLIQKSYAQNPKNGLLTDNVGLKTKLITPEDVIPLEKDPHEF